MLKYLVIALSVIGLLAGIYVVATAKEKIPNPPPDQPPATNPYSNGIAALGFVEPQSKTIAIGASEPGLVVEVLADVNDAVKAGQPLMRLDDRAIRAELLTAEASLVASRASVTRLENAPRPEDIPPVEARAAEARSRLEQIVEKLARLTDAVERNAASPDEIKQWTFDKQTAEAAMHAAEAELARVRAGTWEQDLLVARADVARHEALVRAAQIRLERLTIAAPVDGVVLRRNIEPGAYLAASPPEPPLVLGDIATLRVRAQVNEEDTPMLHQDAPATARVRGPIDARFDLRMVRIEPFARPKQQITGASTELIDTRVVDVVFEVVAREGPDMPRLFPGMAVDVYIDAGASGPK
jgi:HlyD family secretion protein